MTPPEQNKVPTPRTDAELEWQSRHPHELKGLKVVSEHFARTLERELAEAKAEVDKDDLWFDNYRKLSDYITAKLGTKGEHSIYESIDNTASRLSLLTKPIEPEELRASVQYFDAVVWAYESCTNPHKTLGHVDFEMLKTILLAVRQGQGMREALDCLASHCSCNHPTIQLPNGGVKFDSQHHSKSCVSHIAKEALNQLKTGGDGK